GFSGVGQMTVSNGVWLANVVGLGNGQGARGTLTITGGTNRFGGGFDLGTNGGATGTVSMTSGELTVTNGETRIGSFGVGDFTVSNGLLRLGNVFLGRFAGGTGTLTVASGTVTMDRPVATNAGS